MHEFKAAFSLGLDSTIGFSFYLSSLHWDKIMSTQCVSGQYLNFLLILLLTFHQFFVVVFPRGDTQETGVKYSSQTLSLIVLDNI